jgi:WD40 repeat protein
VLDERSRLRVVITLRADFTDKPLRYVDFGELMNRRFEFVLPLTPDELERTILSPAQRIGLKLEKGLVSTIIREVGNQPGALPLLQYALSELFDKREGRMLTNKAYQEIGGVLGALGRSAETIYAGLDESAQLTTRQLFLRLVTLGEGTEDTRRRVLREELDSLTTVSGQWSTVIDTFGKARLLSFDRDPITRGATIEVAHEALLREWTQLREWLTESRSDVRMQRQLAIAASEWNSAKKDASFLLSGAHLEQFEGWSLNTTIALTQDERAFLTASIAERDRRTTEERARQERELQTAQKLAETEKQSTVRLRSRNRMISGALVLALALTVVAVFFGNQASHSAAEAQKNAVAAEQNAALAQQNAANASASQKLAESERSVAISRELAAAAIINLDVDPERSILLSLQAESTAHTIEAENALHRSILTSRVMLILHHDDVVYDVAYSPDGKRIATACWDGMARVWDAKTGQLLLTLKGHTEAVIAIAYSPDGQRIATGSNDQTAKIWDANSGKELLTLTDPKNWVQGLSFSPDGTRLVIISTNPDTNANNAKLRDIFTGKELLTFSTHQGNKFFKAVAYSPDGKRIATAEIGTNDGVVRVWDALTGQELLSLPVGTQILKIAFSPDGTRIGTVNNAGVNDVQVWDSTTGTLLLTGNFGHTGGPHDIAFSPDGTIVATGGEDQKVNIWNSTTGQVLYKLSGHSTVIEGVAFSPDGTRLVTAGQGDHTARVWDLTPPREALFIPFVNALTNNWSAKISYSPDGMRILSDYSDARIWDAGTGKEVLHFSAPTTTAYSASYSSDGKLVATGNEDNTISVWDGLTGKQGVSLAGHKDLVVQTAFSPDGTRLASASYDGTSIVWDLASGKALLTLHGSPDGITSIAYSPDGKRLVTGYYGAIGADIWDAITGEKLFTLPVDGNISSVTYSPDGKLVAIGRLAGPVLIWDASTGKQLLTLNGHTGEINGLSFSPDGKQLASASYDGTARVWNVSSGVNLLTLYADSAGAGGVSFSPDGKRLAVGGKSGISIFYLQIQDVIALAKSRVTRTLTQEECRQYLHVDACPVAP